MSVSEGDAVEHYGEELCCITVGRFESLSAEEGSKAIHINVVLETFVVYAEMSRFEGSIHTPGRGYAGVVMVCASMVVGPVAAVRDDCFGMSMFERAFGAHDCCSADHKYSGE